MKIESFVITNGIISAELLNYGATLKSLVVPDKNGVLTDVVLGYATGEEYTKNNGYFGATVGRVANRIRNATFSLDGVQYALDKNNIGKHTMHGGFSSFSNRLWSVEKLEKNSVKFSLFSPDGESGFPGNLNVFVTYTVTDGNSLLIEYNALSDKDTPLNFTNHAYFNLNGQANGNVFETLVEINSKSVTTADAERVANGGIADVSGSIFDFRKLKKIGDIYNVSDKDKQVAPVYDAFYPITGKGMRYFAKAIGDKSGIEMQVYSDCEGVQFYTETFLEGRAVKYGTLGKGNAYCFETQGYPDSLNCKKFPPCIVKKGQKFNSKTEFKFIF